MVESKVLSESTAMMLDSWSRWSRGLDAYSSLWYPSASPESRLSVETNVWQSGVTRTPVIIADAERVEAAVQIVRSQDMQLARCLKYRWVYEFSGRRLAKELGTNRTDVWPLVERSEMALQGVLWGGLD
mgnify:FL=1|jgi:hypothetical protein|tara:strand:+ start:132 stop:518 length:387 start_codon:yes stop_codon:yes gene_type:complete